MSKSSHKSFLVCQVLSSYVKFIHGSNYALAVRWTNHLFVLLCAYTTRASLVSVRIPEPGLDAKAHAFAPFLHSVYWLKFWDMSRVNPVTGTELLCKKGHGERRKKEIQRLKGIMHMHYASMQIYFTWNLLMFRYLLVHTVCGHEVSDMHYATSYVT